LRCWMETGHHLDAEKAQEMALEIPEGTPEPSRIAEPLEREVLGIIERARKALIES